MTVLAEVGLRERHEMFLFVHELNGVGILVQTTARDRLAIAHDGANRSILEIEGAGRRHHGPLDHVGCAQ